MKNKEAMKEKWEKKKSRPPATITFFDLLRKSPQPNFSLKCVILTVTFAHVNATCKPARALTVVLTISVYIHRPGGS